MAILDQVAQSKSSFSPASVEEVLGLYIAKKLRDVSNVRSYVTIVESYPVPILQTVLNRTRAKGSLQNPLETLRAELNALSGKEAHE